MKREQLFVLLAPFNGKRVLWSNMKLCCWRRTSRPFLIRFGPAKRSFTEEIPSDTNISEISLSIACLLLSFPLLAPRGEKRKVQFNVGLFRIYWKCTVGRGMFWCKCFLLNIRHHSETFRIGPQFETLDDIDCSEKLNINHFRIFRTHEKAARGKSFIGFIVPQLRGALISCVKINDQSRCWNVWLICLWFTYNPTPTAQIDNCYQSIGYLTCWNWHTWKQTLRRRVNKLQRWPI